jgi:hypothetical protein
VGPKFKPQYHKKKKKKKERKKKKKPPTGLRAWLIKQQMLA